MDSVSENTPILPGFVVVEGPVGVGKTTLANKLAQSFGSSLLLEGAEENPFFERFYDDPKNAADIDFAHHDDDYQLLFQRILQKHSGRHYFNPSQLAF